MKKNKWLALLLAAAVAWSSAIPSVAYAAEAKDTEVAAELFKDTVTETITEDDIAEELPEHEELLWGYLEEILWGNQGISTLGNYAEDVLEGIDLKAYRILKEKIQKIAAGEIASSVVTLSLEELGITKTSWSAQDLGVDAIVKDNAITDEAVNALMEQISPVLRTLMRYLLIDCPMDLYWYDKTVGISSSSPRFRASSSNGVWSLGVTEGFTYRFSVAAEYQDTASDTPLYTVNASAARTAQAAAARAEGIVAKYAGSSDYDKLTAYRKEICDLVSYNHTAADNDATPYGNPWQLIWVFDGDSSTNVVCEGYAKAFQYLCDLTDFQNPAVACYTVNGVMSGGTGAGRHMWNIVTMNDQKNYIVDVTNCDTGTVGADDRLFLAGASGSAAGGYTVALASRSIGYVYDTDMSGMYGDILQIAPSGYEYVPDHVHSWEDHYTVDLAAGCTEDGRRSIHCAGCSEVKDVEVIPATGHVYGAWNVIMAATCTEAGSRSRVCSVCGAEETGTIAALGHDWDTEYTVEKEATCTEKGIRAIHCKRCDEIKAQEEIPAKGHAYGEWSVTIPATCTQAGRGSRICSVCGLEENGVIEALGHDWEAEYTVEKEATCTEEGIRSIHCKRCDEVKVQEKIPATGHSYGEWSIITAPTCTEIGRGSRKCNACGVEETGEIEALGHDWESEYTVEKEATCAEEGIRAIHCKRCDEIKAQEEIPAKGHAYGEWSVAVPVTCTQAGRGSRICSVCGAEETGEIEALGHDWEVEYTVEKEATCTEEGIRAIHCKRCDEIKDQEAIPAAGHRYGEWSIITVATCTESGTRSRVCNVCKAEETGTIAALGHDWDTEYTIEKEATCTETGIRSIHCKRCDEVKVQETIPATGHSYGEWSIITAPTCTKAGRGSRKCSLCGSEETEAIAASGHDWETEYTIEKEATCTAEGSKAIHCKKCDTVMTREIIPAAGHHNETTTQKATISANGLTTTKCTICGSVTSSVPIYAPKAVSLSKTTYTYTGRECKPDVTVTDSSGAIISAAHYTISYSNHKSVGKASVTITFQGNYSGTLTSDFQINPKGTSLTKVKANSKALSVKWKKQTVQTTGYQIQYSTNKNFKGAGNIKISKNKTVSKKVSKLKAKKKYYIRIRTYKTTKGATYYSSWSQTKSAVTKK